MWGLALLLTVTTGCNTSSDNRTSDNESPIKGTLGPQFFELNNISSFPDGSKSLSIANKTEISSGTTTVIGQIRSGSIQGDTIYVSDKEYNNIKVYNKDGSHEYTMSNEGTGTYKYGRAGYITALEDNRLLISDMRSGQIKLFSIIEEELSFIKNITGKGVTTIDFCELDGRIFVRGTIKGNRKSGLIHVFNKNGKKVRSFGTYPNYGNELLNWEISKGQIACNEESNIIITNSVVLPVISAYTPKGESVWEHKIPKFDLADIVVDRNIVDIRTSLEHDIIYSLEAVEGTRGFLVQVRHRNESSRSDEKYDMGTYYVNPQGKLAHITNEDHGQYLDTNGSLLISKSDLPAPKIHISSISN